MNEKQFSIFGEHTQIILETSRFLNTQLEMDKLLEVVLEQAISVLKAEAGTLWLVEEEGILVPVIAKGPKSAALKGLHLKPGEGLAGQVVVQNEPRLVKNVLDDASWASRFDEATGFKTFSLLCIPLRGRQEVIGCLQLVNKQGQKNFNEVDLEIAMAFAGQAAIALENSRLYTWQNMLLTSLIQVLADALDARDPYSHGHSQRVAKYSTIIGRELGFSEDQLEALKRSALLHDIGKIGIRDAILLQKGSLSNSEWEVMKTHPEIGARILSGVNPPQLAKKIIEGVLHHQERFDGKGYPHNIKGKEIPFMARIIAVADAFDAITNDRPYRKKASVAEALEEIKRHSGTQFDPQIVEIFIQVMEKEPG